MATNSFQFRTVWSASAAWMLWSSPLSMVFAAVFDEVARSQVGAFIKRAAALYGSS